MLRESYNGSVVFSSTWTSYNQPLMMTGNPSSAQFSYEANHQRWKQVASYSGSSEVTEYIGGLLEKVTTPTSTQYHHYLPAGNNFVVFSRWSTGSNFFYYATQDHLGSTALLTDSAGARILTEKFAALGWRENSTSDMASIANVTRTFP